jgi:hypothetical protein
MDIYLFTMILNWLWYIFSILFVLYRFTSFFTYVYGFFKFLGKLFEGLIYFKNQSFNSFNYTIVDDLEQGELYTRRNKTVFQKVQDTWNGLFSSGYNIPQNKPLIPLTTTTREAPDSFFRMAKPDLRDSSTMTLDSDYFLHTKTHSKETQNENENVVIQKEEINKFHNTTFNKHLYLYMKDNQSTISNVNVEIDDFHSVGYSETVNEWMDNEKTKNSSKNKLQLHDSLYDSLGVYY